MIKTIKKYLSGCLKLVPMRHSEPAKQVKNLNAMKNKILRLSLKMTDKCSGCLKNLRLLIILCLFAHTAYAQNDIAKTENYLPNGKYRLFGSGRGEVRNIDNQIRLHGQLSQQAGNLSIETRLYQGDLSYQQHFYNHGHSVHAPFENKAQRNFSAKTGSVVQGGATLTDLSVTGYEIHPADAYDGPQGGGYPVPTGARDEYLYKVQGKEVSVKVVALDKLPPKANDNQLLRQVGIVPERDNPPQPTDNRTPIERISFANTNNGNAYGDFVDLTHNGQGWESVANPMLMTSWSLPVPEHKTTFNNQSKPYNSNTIVEMSKIPTAPERGAAYYSNPSVHFGRIVPQARMVLDNSKPSTSENPVSDRVSFANATPAPTYNPYDYPTSLPLFNNPLHKGKGSSSAGNSGDDKQNNDNDPPVLGYYYGDDDDLHFYSNSPYFDPVDNNDDNTDLLGFYPIINDEQPNAYPINAPYGLAYYTNKNEQNSESSWWDTGKYLTPIYGDWLSFKEAESGWDYALAVVGIVPSPWTKGAKGVNVANKARKAANKAGDAAGGGSSAYTHFPSDPNNLTKALGVQPKVSTTQHGTTRMEWQPNSNTKIRYESHPNDVGTYNPRHHGEHYHVEIKPDNLTWNQAKRQGQITKVKPENYQPGTGTGFIPGEKHPGVQ